MEQICEKNKLAANSTNNSQKCALNWLSWLNAAPKSTKKAATAIAIAGLPFFIVADLHKLMPTPIAGRK